MIQSKRYSLTNKTIELYVKKSPPIGRGFILFLAFVSVALPILGMVFRFMDGGSFHFGFIIGLGAFSLIGFYFVRLFLWNTYGKEVITIGETTVSYYVDYHYFKGNQQEITYEELVFDIEPIGFEEEKLGRLIIAANDKDFIHSSVNMDLRELEEIVEELTVLSSQFTVA
ncbi:hypothetical protein SY27_16215 [Flavobacterium sp. 316]|uniref:hypothetical protein n=1 Tax=Flavobacterium sp. 316 TaxID=1603293 RepID=UPI0005EA50C4|nr:hypothetical protein [Flavobacterium sp. 316]KIX20059.1 hypothetical protein SY27_16215 [Flavobacterium sp. 316]